MMSIFNQLVEKDLVGSPQVDTKMLRAGFLFDGTARSSCFKWNLDTFSFEPRFRHM
jgi:hypothetical protein